MRLQPARVTVLVVRCEAFLTRIRRRSQSHSEFGIGHSLVECREELVRIVEHLIDLGVRVVRISSKAVIDAKQEVTTSGHSLPQCSFAK